MIPTRGRGPRTPPWPRRGADLAVLVAEDGSTDDTASAPERYAPDPRVRVLKLPHRGVRAATGQPACQTEEIRIRNGTRGIPPRHDVKQGP